mmetsp:Transcript_11746/g.23630  ORF Transcript_11746/g.23630 Transcript_11746/m.23630 type:complete len:110 (-) Transcript_11746:270-599(-)
MKMKASTMLILPGYHLGEVDKTKSSRTRASSPEQTWIPTTFLGTGIQPGSWRAEEGFSGSSVAKRFGSPNMQSAQDVRLARPGELLVPLCGGCPGRAQPHTVAQCPAGR